MAITQELAFRELAADEWDLAAGLAASSLAPEEEESESFGLGPEGPPAPPVRAWGLFMRGGLAAALWLRPPAGESQEIAGVAIPRRRRRMGLFVWMAGELSRSLAGAGIRELRVTLTEGAPAVGEALAEAFFEGPDPEDGNYPAGEWRRRLDV